MSTLLCIQARMSSSRLPGKVLLPIAGAPLLERMIERVRAAKIDGEIVIITSSEAADDQVEKLCKRMGTPCFRGHRTDLLDRHYQAALKHGATIVAKIPSDCPLIDPLIIRSVFDTFQSGKFDYMSNLHPASYPDGNDVEVIRFSALEKAWNEANRDFEREHTTPFIWEHPQQFKVGNVTWETGLDYSMTHRWTIDYPEDYEFIRAVFDRLWTPNHPVFSMQNILELIDTNPEIAVINARYRGVNWYRNHIHELHTITSAQTRILEPELA